MRKLFAMLLTLIMSFQLIVPAWADVAVETTESTAAAEENWEDIGGEEPSEEMTETVEELTTVPMETSPEETMDIMKSEKYWVTFICTPGNLTLVVYSADSDVDFAIPPEENGSYQLEAGEYVYLATAEGYLTEEKTFAVEENCEMEVSLKPVAENDAESSTHETVLASGKCGENVNWVLTENGTLTISGSGKMENYDQYIEEGSNISSTAPWNAFREKISDVVVEPGIENIGSFAFDNYNSLERVYISAGVTSIGDGAFMDCHSLINISILEGVTTIGGGAFCACWSIVDINMPESLTKIGVGAFENCTSIKSIRIPGKVNAIEGGTFYGCESLTSIVIPESVSSIGDYAFSCCSSLTNVYIPENVTMIGDDAFDGCQNLTSIVIPKGITKIAYRAFMRSGIASIYIPKTVQTIEEEAFLGCEALRNIYYGGSVEDWWTMNIGLNNDSLWKDNTVHYYDRSHMCKLLEIPSKAATCSEDGNDTYYICEICQNVYKDGNGTQTTTAESETFPALGHDLIKTEAAEPTWFAPGNNEYYVCSRCEKAFKDSEGTVETTVDAESLEQLQSIAYGSCGENLTWVLDCKYNLIISGSGAMTNFRRNSTYDEETDEILVDTDIPWYANREKIESVSLPEGLTSIGSYAFFGCSSLTSVHIPEKVTSIGARAFSRCTGITRINIPEGVESIEDSVFLACSSLINVRIPEGVTSIGMQSFWGCSGLESINIPEAVMSIGELAFYGCSNLKSITIPQNITTIECGTFSDCSSLTSIIIPESVTIIESSAFTGCSGLTNIVLPPNVTRIKMNTFSGCSSLVNIRIPEGVTRVDECAFASCRSLTNIVLPSNVAKIKRSAFYGCSSLISIYIPEDVKKIEDSAFSRCNKLKDVYYSGTKEGWKQIQIGEDNIPLTRANIHYQVQNGTQIQPAEREKMDGGDTLKLSVVSLMTGKKLSAHWTLAEGDDAYASITEDGVLVAKPVMESVEVTVISEPKNGEPVARKTIQIDPKATELLLMLAGETLSGELSVDQYDTETLELAAKKNPGNVTQAVRWSSNAITVAKVDQNGVVTLLRPGTAVIQATTTDGVKLTGKITLRVIYSDHSPRLAANVLNLNEAIVGGISVDFVEAYGNSVDKIMLDDERFDISYMENHLTIRVNEILKEGAYSVNLSATCADGRTYTYPLTIKVTNSLPKVTVKQEGKLNLFYRNDAATLNITVPNQTITNVELTGTDDFVLDQNGDQLFIRCADPENIPAKPNTKAVLNVYLEGYQTPVKVNLTIATVTTAPAVKLSAASSTLNTTRNKMMQTRVTLLDKSGQPLALEAPVVISSANGHVTVAGNQVTITLNEAKGATVTFEIQDSSWARPVKLTHRISVSAKLPTLKPASNLTLNSLFAQRIVETGMVLSQSNLSLANVELMPAAKVGTAARTESDKLRVVYDPADGHITAEIADPAKLPKTGSYSFTCIGVLETGETISGGTLKVTVAAAAPKVKLSASSLKLNQYLAKAEKGSVNVNIDAGYRVTGFKGLPGNLSYDASTGVLTAVLRSNTDAGGTYTLYPVIRDLLTDEEVTLPTKLTFKIQSYESGKLGVSLSVKGKLDTQQPSELLYTVNKLTDCLGAVDDVTLDGQDADLFRANLDNINGKTIVRLNMLEGKTYATNKAYKVQFRFRACGVDILSTVQTVRVSQTATKVTVPKTITYYQAQKSPLRCVLAANVPLESIELNPKTAKEFLEALGEMRVDGDRIEFEITNPAVLMAGKSYSVLLNVTPENNAENVKPITVKLTVKFMK